MTDAPIKVIRNIRPGLNYYTAPGFLTVADFCTERLDDCVCRIFAVSRAELFGDCRERRIMNARHMYRFTLHKIYGWSDTSVARVMGCKERTSIINASKTAKALIETDMAYRDKYEYVKEKIDKGLIIKPEKPCYK